MLFFPDLEDKTPDLLETYLNLEKENKSLYDEVGRLQQESRALMEKLDTVQLGEQFLRGRNSFKTIFFTGFPSYEVFAWAVAFCSAVLPASRTLSAANVFLLIMMKLRLNRLSQDPAYRFNISFSTASTLPAIARKLSFLVQWPGKEDVIRTLPSVFKPSLRKCRVIIDCTEIFFERSRNLTLRALTWSNYKHHNTLKLLIGISLTRAVCFICKAFGEGFLIKL